MATVHHELCAGDEVSLVRGEEERSRRDLLRAARPPGAEGAAGAAQGSELPHSRAERGGSVGSRRAYVLRL